MHVMFAGGDETQHMMSVQGHGISTATAALINQGRERRATLRALNIWSSARENGEIPLLSSLTESAHRAGQREVFTANQFLILFEPYSSNSVIIFYGHDLPELPSLRMAGKNLHETLPAALTGIFHDACVEAAGNGDAVYRHGSIRLPSGVDVLYRSIFMPLRSASQNGRIYIFGAFCSEQNGTELLAAA